MPLSLAFGRRAERGERFKLRLGEHVGGRHLMSAVAFLGELNLDTRCFGGDGGALDEAFGGAELTVFQLQSLRFHHSERLLDCPARLVPTDDPPRLGRIGDVVRSQQPPMQRPPFLWVDFLYRRWR